MDTGVDRHWTNKIFSVIILNSELSSLLDSKMFLNYLTVAIMTGQIILTVFFLFLKLLSPMPISFGEYAVALI